MRKFGRTYKPIFFIAFSFYVFSLFANNFRYRHTHTHSHMHTYKYNYAHISKFTQIPGNSTTFPSLSLQTHLHTCISFIYMCVFVPPPTFNASLRLAKSLQSSSFVKFFAYFAAALLFSCCPLCFFFRLIFKKVQQCGTRGE